MGSIRATASFNPAVNSEECPEPPPHEEAQLCDQSEAIRLSRAAVYDENEKEADTVSSGKRRASFKWRLEIKICYFLMWVNFTCGLFLPISVLI